MLPGSPKGRDEGSMEGLGGLGGGTKGFGTGLGIGFPLLSVFPICGSSKCRLVVGRKSIFSFINGRVDRSHVLRWCPSDVDGVPPMLMVSLRCYPCRAHFTTRSANVVTAVRFEMTFFSVWVLNKYFLKNCEGNESKGNGNTLVVPHSNAWRKRVALLRTTEKKQNMKQKNQE